MEHSDLHTSSKAMPQHLERRGAGAGKVYSVKLSKHLIKLALDINSDFKFVIRYNKPRYRKSVLLNTAFISRIS